MPRPVLHGRLPRRLDPPQGHAGIIIEDWCIGCGTCANNCPYGNINMHEFPVMAAFDRTRTAQKAHVVHKATSCDLCHDFLSRAACTLSARCRHRVTPNQFFSEILSQERPDES